MNDISLSAPSPSLTPSTMTFLLLVLSLITSLICENGHANVNLVYNLFASEIPAQS